MILLLLACSVPKGAPDPVAARATVESTLAGCASYTHLAEVHGVCLVERVTSLTTVVEVDAVCTKAGRWEDACREAWVGEQDRLRTGRSPEELLAACGTNDDCAFQILDTRMGGDVLVQVERCEAHVADYLSDCVGHALFRWVAERRPDDAEARRVVAALPRYASLVGSALGRAEVCERSMRCGDAVGPAWDACRASRADHLREPGRCGPGPGAAPGTAPGAATGTGAQGPHRDEGAAPATR